MSDIIVWGNTARSGANDLPVVVAAVLENKLTLSIEYQVLIMFSLTESEHETHKANTVIIIIIIIMLQNQEIQYVTTSKSTI